MPEKDGIQDGNKDGEEQDKGDDTLTPIDNIFEEANGSFNMSSHVEEKDDEQEAPKCQNQTSTVRKNPIRTQYLLKATATTKSQGTSLLANSKKGNFKKTSAKKQVNKPTLIEDQQNLNFEKLEQKIAHMTETMANIMAESMATLIDKLQEVKTQPNIQKDRNIMETPKVTHQEVRQPTVIVQQITPITPPKFNGDLDESLNWLTQYKEAANANNWTEDIRIKQVCQSLELAARSWYRTTWRSCLPKTWQEFETGFKEAFVIGTSEDYLRLKLTKLRQKDDQTLLEYFHKSLEDCVLGDESLSDHVKISFIINGMAPEPKLLMKLLKPRSIRELQENVNNYMKAHPQRIRRRPSQGQERDNYSRPERPIEERWCICCGKNGHYSKMCNQRQDDHTISKRKAEWRNNPPWLKPQQQSKHRANATCVGSPMAEENARTVQVNIKNREIMQEDNPKTSSVKIKSLSKPADLTKIHCRINGLQTQAIVDTGATVSVVPLEVALATKTDLYEWKHKDLELADGTSQKPLAECRINIEYRDRTFSVDAVVLVDAPDILLGEDYLKQASMVISYHDKLTTYHDKYMETVKEYCEAIKPKEEPHAQASKVIAKKAQIKQSTINSNVQSDAFYYEYYEEVKEPQNKLYRVKKSESEKLNQETLIKTKRKIIIPPQSKARVEVKVSGEVTRNKFYLMEPQPINRAAIIPGIGKSNSGVMDIVNLGKEPLTIERRTQIARAVSPATTVKGDNDVAIGASLTNEQKKEIDRLITKYKQSFIMDNKSLGLTSFTEHTIDTGESLPIRSKPYRVSHKEQQIIQELINEMLEDNIIRKSNSPWASPIVLVKKKDSSEIRFCVDYRKLNKITKIDPYPIPNMDNVLETLSGNHFFSKLDIKAMYWQVNVQEESRMKTAFVVNCGQYEFNRMPFGLVSAPMTAMRVMNEVTNGMEDKCFVFYDDILIFTPTFEAHIEALQELFERLEKANIKLNKEKCSIALNTVKYLGHIVTQGGIEPDPGKVKAIRNFKIPTNITEARSFIGMCNFYRRFIQGFADIARPIHDTFKKQTTFKWTEEATQAMETLKDKLTSPPLLVHYCPNSKLTIRCDASGYGIGAVLLQENENRNLTGIVEFTSRTLSKSEQNYATTHKECLAVVHSILKWRHYLYGINFTVVTDHHALCWLMSQEKHTGQLMRWSLLLTEFTFKIVYNSGRNHGDADCLSRYPLETTEDPQEEEVPTWPIHDIKKSKSTVYAVNFKSNEPLQPVYNVQEEQKQDEFCQEIVKILLDPTAYSKNTKKKFKNYALKEEILYKRSKQNGSKYLLVLPRTMINYVLEETHDKPTGGHFGVKKTLYKIKQRFYWKTQDEDVKKYIASCDSCQRRKTNYNDKPGLMIPMPIPRRTFEKIGMDILGPLPKSNDGNQFVLVITDYLSKFVIAQPMKKATTRNILQILKKHVFYVHGTPESIITDNGSNLTSREMNKLLNQLGIIHRVTVPYRPQTNGQTERYNRVIGTQLTIIAGKNQRTWDQYLDALAYAYNTVEHSSTLATPYFLIFGKEPTLKLEQIIGRPMQAEPTEGTDTVDESEILEEARKSAKRMIEHSQVKNKLRYDKNRYTKDYKLGDLVLRHRPFGPNGKLDEPWVGPYKVTKRISTVNYQIESTDNPELYHIVHVTQIKPYISRRDASQKEGEAESPEIQTERQSNDIEQIDATESDAQAHRTEPAR